MTDTTLAAPGLRSTLRSLWQDQRVWLASALILAALAVFDPPQAAGSALFAGQALLNTAPFLILSIAIAAWANALPAGDRRGGAAGARRGARRGGGGALADHRRRPLRARRRR